MTERLTTSDTSELDAPPPEPTDVRFSLGAILIWTIVVAVGAAALGPYFRGLDPAVRQQVGTLWGICIAFTAIWIGHAARSRYRLERAAGANLLELLPASRTFNATSSWMAYVGGALLIGLGIGYLLLAANMLERRQNVAAQLYVYLFFGLICGRIVAHGVATIWWNRTVQLRELGVLQGLRLLCWDHATDCRWGRWTGTLSFEGVDQRHRDARFHVALPGSYVEPALAIVADKLSALLSSQASTLPRGVSAPPLFPLATRRETAARGCLIGLVSYLVGGLVVAQFWFVQTPMFKYGCLAGLAAGVVAAVSSERQTGKAGPPRVRLATRFDGPMLLARLGIAATLFYVGRWLSGFNPLFAGVAGLACGLALFAVIGVVSQFKLDLCDNGIAITRWMFWPWQSLSVRRKGNQVSFHRRWSRVAALVPTEHAAVIDALLKEKLAKATSDV